MCNIYTRVIFHAISICIYLCNFIVIIACGIVSKFWKFNCCGFCCIICYFPALGVIFHCSFFISYFNDLILIWCCWRLPIQSLISLKGSLYFSYNWCIWKCCSCITINQIAVLIVGNCCSHVLIYIHHNFVNRCIISDIHITAWYFWNLVIICSRCRVSNLIKTDLTILTILYILLIAIFKYCSIFISLLKKEWECIFLGGSSV